MFKNNQKGFGALFILLILIVCAAVSTAGWFVYNNYRSEEARSSYNTSTKQEQDNAIDKNSPTESKEWCDDHENICIQYGNDWSLEEVDNSEIYTLAAGAQGTMFISPNNTKVMYSSGIIDDLNDAVDNCSKRSDDYLKPDIIERTAIGANNIDYIKFTWGENRENSFNIAAISPEYFPGSIPDGGCGTMVTFEETDDGETKLSTTLMTSILSKNKGEKVIFASTAKVNTLDLADTEKLIKSIQYK